MPQNVGYPATTLAGPDGRPAMEPGSNTPLTIEALLARRGLLGVNSGMTNMSANTAYTAGVPTLPNSGPTVESGMASGGAPASSNNMGGAVPQDGGGDVAPVEQEDMTQFIPPDATPEEVAAIEEASMLDQALIGAGVGGGAFLGYKLMQMYQARGIQPPAPVVVAAQQMQGLGNAARGLPAPTRTLALPAPTLALPAPAAAAAAAAAAPAPAEESATRAALAKRAEATRASYDMIDALKASGMQTAPTGRGARPAPQNDSAGVRRTLDRTGAEQALDAGVRRTIERSAIEQALGARKPAAKAPRIPRVRM